MKRLKEGNARFVADKLKEATPPSRQRLATAEKQKPIAIILTCADSRAAPEYIFDKGIGVLFVVRVAGNVGGPEVYASMEYAAAVLKAPLVVVLGHSNCGAVEAVVKGKDLPTEHLKNLTRLIQTGDDPRTSTPPSTTTSSPRPSKSPSRVRCSRISHRPAASRSCRRFTI